MKPRCRFTLRTMAVLLTVFAIALAWIGREYRIVQERRAAWQFNDHDFCLRAIGVAKVENGVLQPYPSKRVPWIREWLGDHPQQHLLYDPGKDLDGNHLRRIRALFPEAKIWGTRWTRGPTLPAGVEFLTDDHYMRI